MAQTHIMQNANLSIWARNGKWGAIVLLAVIAAGVLALNWSGGAEQQTAPAPLPVAPNPAASPVASKPTVSTPPAITFNPATVARQQQHAAAAAVVHQTSSRPITGTIKERPEFVSELEWQVLRAVASKSTDSDHELTRLVSNLRFSKQLDLWRSGANAADQSQRQALGWQLLQDIPDSVSNKALDFTEAQKLQDELLTSLISDPALRAQRAAAEAKRLTGLYATETPAPAASK